MLNGIQQLILRTFKRWELTKISVLALWNQLKKEDWSFGLTPFMQMKKDGLGVKILLPKFTVSLQNEGRYYWILSKCSRKILNEGYPLSSSKLWGLRNVIQMEVQNQIHKKNMQACFQIPNATSAIKTKTTKKTQ